MSTACSYFHSCVKPLSPDCYSVPYQQSVVDFLTLTANHLSLCEECRVSEVAKPMSERLLDLALLERRSLSFPKGLQSLSKLVSLLVSWLTHPSTHAST